MIARAGSALRLNRWNLGLKPRPAVASERRSGSTESRGLRAADSWVAFTAALSQGGMEFGSSERDHYRFVAPAGLAGGESGESPDGVLHGSGGSVSTGSQG